MKKAWLSTILLVVLMPLVGAPARADRSYVVRPGDTLEGLARTFDTTVAALTASNRLSGDLLRIGQVLRVPDGSVGGYRITIAQPGETLTAIAARVGRTVATLLSANPGLGPDGVRSGAPVSVPPADGVTVMAASGDTLAALAERVGVPVAALAALNGLGDRQQLRPGQPVLVPGSLPSGGGGAGADGSASTYRSITSNADVAGAVTSATVSEGTARGRLRLLQDQALRAAVARLPSVAFGSRTFVPPVRGVITSRFGWRALSVNGNHFHAGVDLAAPMGTPVHAARDGVVVKAGWGGSYGNVVFLDHGDGTQTRYAHLSRIEVRVGESVRQGDVLGLVGSTGASTGPHVHFELRFDGRAVNPLDYLQGMAGR